MEYLTYDEYKDIGGTLNPAAFSRYSLRAFARIRKETDGRIDKMLRIPKEVKHLCRDLIEYMSNNLNQDKALSSTSQQQGGSSESEVYVYIKPSEHEAYISEIIDNYLGALTDNKGTPLLYWGCSDAE